MPSENVLAIVVDDNKVAREGLIDLMNRRGFYAIGASSSREALRDIRSLPGVELVVTDIDLREEGSNRPDSRGADLAKEIKARRPDLPVVAHTAHDDDAYISQIDWKLFAHRVDKAAFNSNEGIARYRKIALDFREKRLASVKERLDLLRQKYNIADRDIAIIRGLLPTSLNSAASEESEDLNSLAADEILSRLGFAIRMLEAGTHHLRADDVEEDGSPDKEVSFHTHVSVPVWIQRPEGESVVEVQVHGHPTLYATGSSDEDAMKALLIVMYTLHVDLTHFEVGGPMSLTKDYLKEVFG